MRSHWRLWRNRQDGASVVHYGQERLISPGNAVIVPPDTPIKHRLRNPVDSLAIHFSLGQPFDFFRGKVLSFQLTTSLQNEFDQLCDSLKGIEDAAKIQTMDFRFGLTSLICGMLSSVPEHDWPKPPADERIRKTLSMMEEYLSAPLSNKILAKKAGLCPNAFARLFKLSMGKSPQAHQLSRRLEEASLLLRYSGDSIEAIAEKFGFCDRHYFSRMFRKKYETGPAFYRNSFQ